MLEFSNLKPSFWASWSSNNWTMRLASPTRGALFRAEVDTPKEGDCGQFAMDASKAKWPELFGGFKAGTCADAGYTARFAPRARPRSGARGGRGATRGRGRPADGDDPRLDGDVRPVQEAGAGGGGHARRACT